jgi:hypothetical protein
MSQVLASQAAFEAALKRLQRGDRRCFLFLGASGHFYQGTLAPVWWKEMDGRERHMGGAQFSPNQSPRWPEIEKALNDFLDVYYDIAVVLQDRFTDVPAPIGNLDDIEPPFWADGPRREGRSTLWRLIWADHRYEDGRIPDDEKTYDFGGTIRSSLLARRSGSR